MPDCALCAYDGTALTCSKCLFAFYLDETGSCLSCTTSPIAIVGCADCAYDIPTTTISCNSCDAGYYALDQFTCESCSASAVASVPNCAKCSYDAAATPQLLCSECAVGFYLVKDGTACNPCTDISEGCSACKSVDNNGTNLTCTACKPQYLQYFNDCIFCSDRYSNCTLCDTSNNTCEICGPNFYRAAEGSGCNSCAFQIKDCELC